jgi:hypothetical protein
MRKHLAIIGTVVALSACGGNDTGDMQDTGLGTDMGTPPAAAMPGTDTSMGMSPVVDSTSMRNLQVDTLSDTTGTNTTGTTGTTPPPR